MALEIGTISLRNMFVEQFQFPFYISGTVTAADVGKAVSLDTTANNTVKLAADNDVILGRLEVYEDRVSEGVKVATVSLAGGMEFPVKTGETVNRGDTIQGAGAGEVKALPVSNDTNTNAGAIQNSRHDWNNIVVATRVVSGVTYVTAIVK